MKAKKILMTITFILLCITSIIFSQYNVENIVSKSDVAKIKKIMTRELCSDLKNCLYVINDSYCFWIREGKCSDNSYSYSLYGPKVKLLCYQRETIAGIDKKCNKESEKMFTTIIDNLQKENLGLESSIKVKMVYSLK
jgi:hypothetical protein